MPVNEFEVVQVDKVGYFEQSFEDAELADVGLELALILNQQSTQRVVLLSLQVYSFREVLLARVTFGCSSLESVRFVEDLLEFEVVEGHAANGPLNRLPGERIASLNEVVLRKLLEIHSPLLVLVEQLLPRVVVLGSSLGWVEIRGVGEIECH